MRFSLCFTYFLPAGWDNPVQSLYRETPCIRQDEGSSVWDMTWRMVYTILAWSSLKSSSAALKYRSTGNIIDCLVLSDPEQCARCRAEWHTDTVWRDTTLGPGRLQTTGRHWHPHSALPVSGQLKSFLKRCYHIVKWSGTLFLPAVTSVQCSLSIDCDLILSRFRHL